MPPGPRALLRRARKGDLQAALAAAQHPEATGPELEELCHLGDTETRAAVARHPQADSETLTRLALDPELTVAAAVAERPALSAKLIDSLAVRSRADFALRRGRDRAAVLQIILSMADNETIPLDVTTKTLEIVTNSQLTRLLASQTHRTAVLDIMLHHPKPTVRQELVDNPALPIEFLERLADDANDKVRHRAIQALAARTGTSPAARKCETLATWNTQVARLGAPTWDVDHLALFGGPESHAERCAFFKDLLKGAAHILILGAENGWLIKELGASDAGASYLGVEYAGPLLERCAALCGSIAHTACKPWAPPCPLPVEPGTVDLILVPATAHRFGDPQALLRSFRAVLHPGARVAGEFLCLTGTSPEAEFLAESALREGVLLLSPEEWTTSLATSGLVVEQLSTTPIRLPAADEPDILATVTVSPWQGLLPPGPPTGTCDLGLLRFSGRQPSF